MPELTLSTLISKARAIGGPYLAAALLCVGAGYFLRGTVEAQSTTNAAVARLDSVAIKREEFNSTIVQLRADLNGAVQRIGDVAQRQDSTNKLLRRFICRSQPPICP